jgi:hypothetical protein
MKRRYALNRRSGVLHNFPTLEGCNWDQVPQKQRKYYARRGEIEPDDYDHFCLNCLTHETSRKR